MKIWQTVLISLLFGLFLYFMALEELWFALIPVLLLVLLMIVSRIPFRRSTREGRVSIPIFVLPFLLISLAYFIPADPFYAAALGIISTALLIALLHKKKPI